MMEDGNEQWHFTDITALPDWIIVLERKLENVIHQHLLEG
jgi:hypothetical protein